MKLFGTIMCDLEEGTITEETIGALNQLAGSGFCARFVLTPIRNSTNKNLSMKFSSVKQAYNWCHILNKKAFPHQWGRCMGANGDPIVKELDLEFRFPNEFFHIVMYVSEGSIFHKDGQWQVSPAMDRNGYWETGYKREPFKTWMFRQFLRLEHPEIQELLSNMETSTASGKLSSGLNVPVKPFSSSNWQKRQQKLKSMQRFVQPTRGKGTPGSLHGRTRALSMSAATSTKPRIVSYTPSSTRRVSAPSSSRRRVSFSTV